MTIRRKGKYVIVDTDNPNGVGVCDDSGFVFNHKDLHKQMEWRGNNLVWTGLMVGTPYLDKPQEQNRPPLIKADPYPLKNPRLPVPYSNSDEPVVPPYEELLRRLKQVKWGQ